MSSFCWLAFGIKLASAWIHWAAWHGMDGMEGHGITWDYKMAGVALTS